MVDREIALRPYERARDATPLFRVLDDPIVWQHIPDGAPECAQALADRFAERMTDGLRWTLVIEVAGVLVGTSSFVFDPNDAAGVEIGATYLSPPTWGSGVNRRTKHLMVSAAFDSGAAVRYCRLSAIM